MTEPQVIMCVECLRIIVRDHKIVFREKFYGYVGGNRLRDVHYKVSPGDYVVHGTHYCAEHALPVYEEQPSYVIQETA